MKERDNFYQDLLRIKLECGKNLIELTAYDDIYLWWFVDFTFHRFIDDLKPDTSFVRFNRLKMSLLLLYRRVNLFVHILNSLFLRILLRFYDRKSRDKHSIRQKIVFTALDVEWRYVRDFSNHRLKKSDSLFDTIINRLKNRYTILGINTPRVFPLQGTRIFIEKLLWGEILYHPFELYWSFQTWKAERRAIKRFDSIWEEIKDDAKLRAFCAQNGRQLYFHVRDKLVLYFRYGFPQIVRRIEIAKEIIRRENPRFILIQDEYRDLGRSLVVAAKLAQIPTLAIQHGVITPTHYGYMWHEDHKDSAMLPKLTCVYGLYHYDLLIHKSIYETDQVKVTGSPRYDLLPVLDRIYSREVFLKKYNINPDHKIVLWTTQTHGLSPEENNKNLETIFGTLQQLEDVTLVIKQHPGETKGNTGLITHHLKNYEINVILTPKKADTLEYLLLCDLMITRHSTTAMEAIALQKPVIILNLSGEPDPVNYVKEGVAVGVYDGNQLRNTIVHLLKGDAELSVNRGKYIEKYLYKIDGRAAERIISAAHLLTKH